MICMPFTSIFNKKNLRFLVSTLSVILIKRWDFRTPSSIYLPLMKASWVGLKYYTAPQQPNLLADSKKFFCTHLTILIVLVSFELHGILVCRDQGYWNEFTSLSLHCLLNFVSILAQHKVPLQKAHCLNNLPIKYGVVKCQVNGEGKVV